MCLEKKTLLFMYINNFFGIQHEGFNFNIRRRFRVHFETNTIHSCPEEFSSVSDTFFGEGISALTLLIGDNGAGKTTLMQLMVKWLCELHAGSYPQECGAFVIRVGDHNKLIAFQGGGPWSLGIAEKSELEEATLEEIQFILKDISLIYYTDTMTDLALEEILTEEQRKYLTDHSLISRLSKALNHPNYFINAKDAIKRAEFAYQLSLFLKLEPAEGFPIHFIKFSSDKIGSSECLEHLRLPGSEGADMILLLKDYGKSIVPGDDGPWMLTRCMLWGLFAGVISSTLLWEQQLFGTQASHFISFFQQAFPRNIMVLSRNVSNVSGEVYSIFKDFFENLCTFVSTISEEALRKKFDLLWEPRLRETLYKYIDLLREIERFYALPGSNFDWQKRSTDNRIIFYTQLNTLQNQWKDVFQLYTNLYHLMPDCGFDWHYASSGEKNFINFRLPLYSTIETDSSKHCLWFLLDEPDNTLHPGWKRRVIRDLHEEIQGLCKGGDKSNASYNYYQLWISTHSPIMLSDVPRQAAIFLSTGNENAERPQSKVSQKKQVQLTRSPFAQQIYTLFNDAFFMKNEVIGAFSEEKIRLAYKYLSTLEANLLGGQDFDIQTAKEQLRYARMILNCIDEPLLRGHILLSYRQCRLELNKRKAFFQEKLDL